MTTLHTAKIDNDRLALRLLSAVPLLLWEACSETALILPYYHIVTDENVPHVKHLYGFRNTRQFGEDLDFFLGRYTPVGLSDIIAHLNGERNLARNSFHLTFDDGFREMYEVVAPILKDKGVPATFFLATAFIDNRSMAHHNQASVLVEHLAQDPDRTILGKVENLLDQNSIPGSNLFSRLTAIRYRDKALVGEAAAICGCDLSGYMSSASPYLTSEQIRSLLKQGFTIGAHSVDHPLYSELPLADQISQTVESLHFLREHFPINHRAFAFPHGDRGVAPEFFETLRTSHHLDVSFGTDGLVKHFCPRNLERFTLEKTPLSARRVVAKQYPRAIYRNFFISQEKSKPKKSFVH